MFSYIRHIRNYLMAKRKFSKNCRFDASTTIVLDSSFEGMNQVHKGSYFKGKLGYGSYVGPNCKISAIIGKYTSVGDEVKTVSGTHPYKEPYVSTSPCFYVTNPLRAQNGGSFVEKDTFKQFRYFDKTNCIDVCIGSDCWIGSRALLIGGISIGDGAVVLAGAVVSKDVAPYSIVGGVPARVLGYRYDEKTINVLLETKWWNRSIEWIRQNVELFSDIESFKHVLLKESR